MKLLVFSDIHGNAQAVERLQDLLPSLSYDKIAFLGDIFGYYYEQERCLKLLREISGLIWLKGNHDEYAADAYFGKRDSEPLIASYGHSYDKLNERFRKSDMELISALPSSCRIDSERDKIGFFHGRPSNPLEGRVYNDTELTEQEFAAYDVVFFGHTHCKIDRSTGRTRVLSPGSLGQPRDGKGYGFLIFDTHSKSCDFINVSVDNEVLRNEINKHDRNIHKLYDVLSRETNV